MTDPTTRTVQDRLHHVQSIIEIVTSHIDSPADEQALDSASGLLEQARCDIEEIEAAEGGSVAAGQADSPTEAADS